jgi:TonB family protein
MLRRLLLMLLGSWLAAQSPDANGVYRGGPGITPPKVLSKKEPQYTEEARKAMVNGRAVLDLVVGDDGIPTNIKVVRGREVGFGLDENAIESVSSWRFEPARKNGEPVKMYATIEVSFALLNKEHKDQWTRLSFSGPGERPVLTKGSMPQNPSAHTVVGLTVTPKGEAVNFKVMLSENDDFTKEVLKEMRGWRFRGAAQDVEGVFEVTTGQPSGPPRPANPAQTALPPQAPLAAIVPPPAIVEPQEGASLDALPRHITLRWQAVPDAATYYVECESISGSDWTSALAGRGALIRATEYAFDFPAAQPGRCRVSSVNRSGQMGPAGSWRAFRYTR